MKNLLKKIILTIPFIERISIFTSNKKKLIPNLLTSCNSRDLREIFMLPESDHYTQLNQDFFALMINGFKKELFFIEIGANDGFNLSNTYYLENHFKWKGILVEPNPRYNESLKKRKSKHINTAISDEIGEIKFVDGGLYGGGLNNLDTAHKKKLEKSQVITVPTNTLLSLFDENTPRRIDYISIDVEGAEIEILKQFDSLPKDIRFSCGTIEHNNRTDDINKITTILKKNNYKIFWLNKTGHDLFFVDNDFQY